MNKNIDPYQVPTLNDQYAHITKLANQLEAAMNTFDNSLIRSTEKHLFTIRQAVLNDEFNAEQLIEAMNEQSGAARYAGRVHMLRETVQALRCDIEKEIRVNYESLEEYHDR